jgi:hypothetical protein
MIRYTVFLIAIVATAATAIASLPAQPMPGANGQNVTELFKNQDWTTAPLVLEQCAKEDCSDTPAS